METILKRCSGTDCLMPAFYFNYFSTIMKLTHLTNSTTIHNEHHAVLGPEGRKLSVVIIHLLRYVAILTTQKHPSPVTHSA